MADKKQSMDLLGLPVDKGLVARDIHEAIDHAVAAKEKTLFYNLNVHAVILSVRLQWFRSFVKRSKIIFCDGDGPRWGLRLLGYQPPVKICTTRWIYELAAHCEQNGHRMFLLGAKPEINRRATERLKGMFPRLHIESQHGYFEKTGAENREVVRKINDFKTDVVMVCFGMPSQEKWLLENWDALECPVRLKGGGVLDYVSGRLGTVPKWMLNLQMEWLFRILEEPGRLFCRYLYEIPYFFILIAGEWCRRLFRGNAE